jgi:capsular polysaccharide biosynthesis protein
VADFNDSNRTVQTEQPNYDPDLLPALRRQWLIIVIAAAVGGFVLWFAGSARPTTFEARSTVLLIAAGDEQDPGGGRDRTLDVETWATVARSTALLQELASTLELELDDVKSDSSAVAAPTGDVLTLSFEASDEQDAITGAATYSDLFLENRELTVNATTRERIEQLEGVRTQLQIEIADREEQIDDEEALGDDASAGRLDVLIDAQQSAIRRLADIEDELITLDPDVATGRVVIDPRSDVDRTGLSPWLLAGAGVLVGALVGLVLALVRDRYDDRYRSAADAERIGLSEIGRVPYLDGITADPTSAMLAYSRVITRLAFAQHREREARSVLILPVESKTLPFDAGHSIGDSLRRCGDRTGVAIGLWGEDVALERTREYWEDTIDAIADLKERADLVVVAERALDHAATGIGIAALVDDVLLVVSEDTRLRDLEDAIEDLHGVNVDDVQVLVLVGVRPRDLRVRNRRFDADDEELLEFEPRPLAEVLAQGDDYDQR